jgi:hypothetical protein
MSYRDDFSSNMNSPSNYKGNTTFGNPSYQGGYGGTNNAGLGFTTPSQRNFAAQGGSFGRGFGFGSLGAASGVNQNNGLGGGVQSGPIRPALGPQGVSTPNTFPPAPVTSLPPALTMAGQYLNPFRWPTIARQNAGIPSYQNPPRAFPNNPRPTGTNTTTIPYNPNGGGYTNISKNNQGNFPNYPNGNGATYNRMGSDFRSIDNW